MKHLTFLLLFLITACSSPSISSFSGIKMMMPYHIQIAEKLSYKEQKQVEAIIDETFAHIDITCNHWNPLSELSRLKDKPLNSPITLSSTLYDLLSITEQVVRMTDGRFDPSLGEHISSWKHHLVANTQLTHQAAPSGWHHLVLEKMRLTKTADVSLDCDGIVKGFAVDLLAKRLKDVGFHNFFIDWSGEIYACGSHPENRAWHVLIPESKNPIKMSDNACATSGSQQQQWVSGDITYTHILDPETKTPLEVTPENIRSVTVFAPTCSLADGLATSCMIFKSSKKAKEWALEVHTKHPDIQIFIKP